MVREREREREREGVRGEGVRGVMLPFWRHLEIIGV